MRFALRVLVLSATLAWPFAAAAVAPLAVTGIRAEMRDGRVVVSWSAPSASEDVASYQIYYGRKSILENDGAYDDFETAPGESTSHTLTDPVLGSTLYVAMLAISASGEQSPFFAEEAAVMVLSPAQPQPTTQQSTSAKNVDASLRLLSAQSVSATGVALTFSDTVRLPVGTGKSAFEIQGVGASVSVTRAIAQGTSVIVHTTNQVPGSVYAVIVNPNMVSGEGPNGTVSMDLKFATKTFRGFGESAPVAQAEAAEAPQQEPAPAREQIQSAIPSAVQNLRLRSEKRSDGQYVVYAEWDKTDNAKTYDVQQSRDGGTTLSPIQSVDSNLTNVRFNGVTPGSFGISVRAVGDRGASQSVFESVNLSGSIGSTIVASVIDRLPTSDSPLAQSGPGILVALAGAGAYAGWRKMKTTKR